jgi:Skp family chaperone for outer membrane proteins
MKKATVLSVLVILIIAAVWSYRTSVAQPGTTPPLKVAVVNVSEVLTKCQENLDREDFVKEKEKEFTTKLNQLKAEADSIRQEIETAVKPGTKEHLELMQQYFDRSALYEAYRKGQPQVLAAETQAWMEALYQKFLDQVAELARVEGISVVLNKDEVPDIATMIRNRRLIYNSPSLDITARVMENLDRDYSRAKADKAKTGS